MKAVNLEYIEREYYSIVILSFCNIFRWLMNVLNKNLTAGADPEIVSGGGVRPLGPNSRAGFGVKRRSDVYGMLRKNTIYLTTPSWIRLSIAFFHYLRMGHNSKSLIS